MTICYSSDFIRGLKRYKRITISIFRKKILFKKWTIWPDHFWQVFIFNILHTTWHQVSSSKTPCLQSKHFSRLLFKNTKKNHIKKLKADINLCFVKLYYKKDPLLDKSLVCGGTLNKKLKTCKSMSLSRKYCNVFTVMNTMLTYCTHFN